MGQFLIRTILVIVKQMAIMILGQKYELVLVLGLIQDYIHNQLNEIFKTNYLKKLGSKIDLVVSMLNKNPLSLR